MSGIEAVLRSNERRSADVSGRGHRGFRERERCPEAKEVAVGERRRHSGSFCVTPWGRDCATLVSPCGGVLRVQGVVRVMRWCRGRGHGNGQEPIAVSRAVEPSGFQPLTSRKAHLVELRDLALGGDSHDEQDQSPERDKHQQEPPERQTGVPKPFYQRCPNYLERNLVKNARARKRKRARHPVCRALTA